MDSSPLDTNTASLNGGTSSVLKAKRAYQKKRPQDDLKAETTTASAPAGTTTTTTTSVIVGEPTVPAITTSTIASTNGSSTETFPSTPLPPPLPVHAELNSYANKLEFLLLNSRVKKRRERNVFQSVLSSLSLFFGSKGVHEKQVAEYVDQVIEDLRTLTTLEDIKTDSAQATIPQTITFNQLDGQDKAVVVLDWMQFLHEKRDEEKKKRDEASSFSSSHQKSLQHLKNSVKSTHSNQLPSQQQTSTSSTIIRLSMNGTTSSTQQPYTAATQKNKPYSKKQRENNNGDQTITAEEGKIKKKRKVQSNSDQNDYATSYQQELPQDIPHQAQPVLSISPQLQYQQSSYLYTPQQPFLNFTLLQQQQQQQQQLQQQQLQQQAMQLKRTYQMLLFNNYPQQTHPQI